MVKGVLSKTTYDARCPLSYRCPAMFVLAAGRGKGRDSGSVGSDGATHGRELHDEISSEYSAFWKESRYFDGW